MAKIVVKSLAVGIVVLTTAHLKTPWINTTSRHAENFIEALERSTVGLTQACLPGLWYGVGETYKGCRPAGGRSKDGRRDAGASGPVPWHHARIKVRSVGPAPTRQDPHDPVAIGGIKPKITTPIDDHAPY